MRRRVHWCWRMGMALVALAAQGETVQQGTCAPELTRAAADPAAGFHWPFYYFVPDRLDSARAAILVLPNNTGRAIDGLAAHEEAACRFAAERKQVAQALGVALLVPAFPRPRSDWHIYTHALDRDALVTTDPLLKRIDLQLIAMIASLRTALKANGIEARQKVLMGGFSGSGMFVNRFTLLHPDRVLGAAIGSPGGWPLAPVAEHAGEPLRYPAGIGDIGALTGSKVKMDEYRKVPQFFFLGAKDANDSVGYRDGWDAEDAERVNRLFGWTLLARWAQAEALYKAAGISAEFRTYNGAGHIINDAMAEDMMQFFRRCRDSR